LSRGDEHERGHLAGRASFFFFVLGLTMKARAVTKFT